MKKEDIAKKRNTSIDNLKDIIEAEASNKDNISVFIGKGTLKTTQPFAILFYKALLDGLMISKLTLTDVKVLMSILDFVSAGNVIHLTHQEIATRLNIKRQQVSKSFMNLLASEFLIQSGNKSLFLNPTIICKESLRSVKESTSYSIVAQNNKEREMAMPF